MHKLWTHLPPWARNPYLLLGGSFLVWMLFFDAEDLLTQYRLRNKLATLRIDKAYYTEQIEKIKQAKEGLTTNPDLLEKLAREKYFMRKATEDLYIVVDE